MICPYCNTVLVDQMELDNCPHCGGGLPTIKDLEERRSAVSKTLSFPNPPIGIYKDADGYFEMGVDCVTFYWKPFFKEHKRIIPYHEIFSVAYNEGNSLNLGFLCVREWKDRHIPLIKKANDAALDETSFVFKSGENNVFFECAYSFLNRCAQIVHEANPECLDNKLYLLMGNYIGHWGYMQIDREAISFTHKTSGSKSLSHTIPYRSIWNVKIQKATAFRRGHLWVWEREGLYLNTTESSNSIDFGEMYNERMQEVYEYLTQWALRNRKLAVQEQSEHNEAEQEASVKLFCPVCRSTAIDTVKIPKSFIHRPLSIRDPKLRILSNSIYIAKVLIQSAEPRVLRCTCIKCGHQWSSMQD